MEFIDNSIQLIGMGYDYNIYRKNYGGLYFDTCVIFKNTFDFVQSKVEVDGEEKKSLSLSTSSIFSKSLGIITHSIRGSLNNDNQSAS
ncbi:Endonuclease/exonuclease/phosphatase [Acinetobacter baumannii]|nr:Endonuclease/exonuclease/phosphatase [Acinetobacter baumannii]